MFATAQHFPANQLLSTETSSEWKLLEPDVEWENLAVGEVLCSCGQPLRYVHFPVTASVSLLSTLADGMSTEAAVVGSEGMVGVNAFMGGADAVSDAIVVRPGQAWRMKASAVQHHSRRSGVLMQKMLAYTQALFAQLTQATVCNKHHTVDQQLCRWLLQHLDCQQSSDMKITHERIAGLLGVRREGVTEGALRLLKAGVIDYHRGHITILDRKGLESRSCECYKVVRRAYDGITTHH